MSRSALWLRFDVLYPFSLEQGGDPAAETGFILTVKSGEAKEYSECENDTSEATGSGRQHFLDASVRCRRASARAEGLQSSLGEI